MQGCMNTTEAGQSRYTMQVATLHASYFIFQYRCYLQFNIAACCLQGQNVFATKVCIA